MSTIVVTKYGSSWDLDRRDTDTYWRIRTIEMAQPEVKILAQPSVQRIVARIGR